MWVGVIVNVNVWMMKLFCNYFQFRTHKVIYRRYAGLFFSVCVDITDNELAYLESIHLFVEILDHFFSNVCELDLVFNFHKVLNLFTYSYPL
jgi:AP-2 complex subunit sigma-1